MASMVTLKDGYQVSKSMLTATMVNINAVAKENDAVLFDLIEKCKNAGYKFIHTSFDDAKAILTEHYLIDENENVHEDIKRIVLNSVEVSGFSINIVDPLSGERVWPLK